MNVDELKVQVKALIAEIIEKDVNEFTDDQSFVEDLGLDSLRALEIIAALEEKFTIQVPEEKLPELTTVNKTVEITKSILG